MRKNPVTIIMAVCLGLIILIAISPLLLDVGASYLIDYTDCGMGDPASPPCMFLGSDWRQTLEDMHFFGWMVSLAVLQLAGIAFLVWLGAAVFLAIIYRLRQKPSSISGNQKC